MHKSMKQSIKEFETQLNIPIGFYSKLLSEDDWSFIIKLSALLETASTNVLTTFLGYKEIENPISYLDYGNIKSGKILLMQKLGIVYKNQAKALRYLLEIRNKIAHRLENINFMFEQYIKEQDTKQNKNFVEMFGQNFLETFFINGKKIHKKDFVLENPKLCIWFTVKEILACMYLSKQKKDMEKELLIKMLEKIYKEKQK